MKTFATLLLCFVTTLAFSIGDYKSADVLYVYAPSGLKLRNVADGETVLATIPYGTKLTTLEARNKTISPKTVDGISGYWAKVSYQGKTGYIFDGYLSFLPAPMAGCTTLTQYCDQFFVPLTKPLVQSLSCDDEVTDENDIQVFNWGNRQIVLTLNHGYEWGGETVSIPNISIEEGWLLTKVLYKADYDTAYNHFKNTSPTQHSIGGQPVNPDDYIVLKPNMPENKTCVLVHFLSECSDELEIVEREKTLVIKRFGGC